MKLASLALALFATLSTSADAFLQGYDANATPQFSGYYSQFSNWPTDPAFFPITVWLQNPLPPGLLNRAKAAGINTLWGIHIASHYYPTGYGTDDGQLAAIKAAGMFVIPNTSSATWKGLYVADDGSSGSVPNSVSSLQRLIKSNGAASTVIAYAVKDEPNQCNNGDKSTTYPYSDSQARGPSVSAATGAVRSYDPTRPVFENFSSALFSGGGTTCSNGVFFPQEWARSGVPSSDAYPNINNYFQRYFVPYTSGSNGLPAGFFPAGYSAKWNDAVWAYGYQAAFQAQLTTTYGGVTAKNGGRKPTIVYLDAGNDAFGASDPFGQTCQLTAKETATTLTILGSVDCNKYNSGNQFIRGGTEIAVGEGFTGALTSDQCSISYSVANCAVTGGSNVGSDDSATIAAAGCSVRAIETSTKFYVTGPGTCSPSAVLAAGSAISGGLGPTSFTGTLSGTCTLHSGLANCNVTGGSVVGSALTVTLNMCNRMINRCPSGTISPYFSPYNSTPAQVNAAAWGAIINGANGLAWFCHGTAQNYQGSGNTLSYSNCLGGAGPASDAIAANLRYINSTVLSYARVLNNTSLGQCRMRPSTYLYYQRWHGVATDPPPATGWGPTMPTKCSHGNLALQTDSIYTPVQGMVKKYAGVEYLFLMVDSGNGAANATITVSDATGKFATIVYDSYAQYLPARSTVGATHALDANGSFTDTLTGDFGYGSACKFGYPSTGTDTTAAGTADCYGAHAGSYQVKIYTIQ